MLGSAGSATIQVLLICALLIIPSGARADGDSPEDEEIQKHKVVTSKDIQRFDREILLHADLPRGDSDAFHDRFYLTPHRGIEYRQRIPLGDSQISLKLYGPIVKKKPGLGLRLKGSVGDVDLKLKAYGSVKKQGISIGIDF